MCLEWDSCRSGCPAATIGSDTLLISYALDEELGAISFEEELAALRWMLEGMVRFHGTVFR
jgi:hypothetical protein